MRRNQIDRAIHLFETEAAYAETADIKEGHADVGPGKTPSYPLGAIAQNDLALAYIAKGDYLQARLWCQEALGSDDSNKDVLSNLAKISEKLRNWKWPITTTGEYLQYAGMGQWNSFCVRQLNADKISVSFSGMWNGLGFLKYGPSGIGDFKATVALKNGTAVYDGEAEFPCKVHMKFMPDQVELSQTGDCGFGHNVEASGRFDRVSVLPDCN